MLQLVKQKGQGLIEILIVAVMIVICCVSLFQFQATLSYRDSLALQTSDATILASQELETLRDFSVTSAASGSYTSIADSSTSPTVGNYNTTYTISWTVYQSTSPAYKTITVTVTWNDLRANPQTVTLSTNVGEVDPVYSATVIY